MKKTTSTLFTLAVLFAVPLASQATPMIYTPVNPSFGGSPFNGTTLMTEANVQNTHTAPVKPYDAQANFGSTITSALLGQVSSKIAESIYGPNAQNSGEFLVGTTKIDFNHDNGQVVVNITDLGTGQQTTVSIPAGI